MEQQLGALLNTKLDDFEQALSGRLSAEGQCDPSRFRSEADAIMQQLVALNQYIADHEQYALPPNCPIMASTLMLLLCL